MSYPLTTRRMRLSPHIRQLTQDVTLSYKQAIQPLFVVEGIDEKQPIPGIPGTYRDTPETLLRQIESDLEAGVTKFILFGVGQHKAEHDFDYGFHQQQITAIKHRFGSDLWLAVDVCLCSSTDHGHCGILSAARDHVQNDASCQALAAQALAFAQSGADCIAPSDMMDGRIAAIRSALNDNDLSRVSILSYAVKYASHFYGPFRVACDSKPGQADVKLKDRKTYQMDFRRRDEAVLMAQRDEMEGADMLMVKPATHYLDVIQNVKAVTHLPLAAYYVSGEHALVECAAEKGLISSAKDGHLEALTAIKRAGADIMITYAARYMKDWLAV